MRWFESSRPSMVRHGAPPHGEPHVNEVLRTLLEAFERGDLSVVTDCFCEDATYREARRAPLCGRAAIGQHFARWTSSGVPWRFTVDEVIEAGRRACVVYTFAVGGGAGEPWRERAGCALVRFGERSLIAEWREYEG